jgi:hypothetical protein
LVETLDSPSQVIGSIGLKGSHFIQEIKSRGDVKLFPVSNETLDSLVSILLATLQRA